MHIFEDMKAWLCDLFCDIPSWVFLENGYFNKEDICIRPQIIPINLTVNVRRQFPPSS